MKKITSLVLTLIMLMTLTACGNDGSSQTEGGEGDTTPPASGETAILTIGTGDTGGAMYPIGSTIAKIVNNNVPGVKMNVESTGGSVDNARMTSTGELELGLCGGDVAYSAQNGKDAFEGAACEGYSGLFAYSVSTAIFISSQASGVDSVEDWAGHRLTFGMTGSSTATALANQLPVAGVELTRFGAPVYERC